MFDGFVYVCIYVQIKDFLTYPHYDTTFNHRNELFLAFIYQL